MGKITRMTLFKLPKPEDQEAALEAYTKMFAEAKKVSMSTIMPVELALARFVHAEGAKLTSLL
jgi:hypothetical protein